MGSNRRFGLILVAVCIFFYALGFRHGSGHLTWLVAAAFFLLIAVLMPRILQPTEILWMNKKMRQQRAKSRVQTRTRAQRVEYDAATK